MLIKNCTTISNWMPHRSSNLPPAPAVLCVVTRNLSGSNNKFVSNILAKCA